MTMITLNDRALTEVTGGLTWELILAGATALIGGSYMAGEALGEAYYHLVND